MIIITKLENQNIEKKIRLQIIIKLINDIIKYNDLILILLIFEIFFYIINDDISTLSIIERAKVINIIIIKIIKLHAKR